MTPKNILEKIWDAHVVHEAPGEPSVLYVDLHLVHEVTSPQAFDGLRMAGRAVRRPDLTIATADHNTPTWDRSLPITDPISKQQLDALSRNCSEFGITLYDMYSPNQGIVHIIGPSKATRNRARPSSAATATPPRTGRSARLPSVSAPHRSSSFWRLSASCSPGSRPWRSVSRAPFPRE